MNSEQSPIYQLTLNNNNSFSNDPPRNEYLPINYHKMNQFPFFLIGKISSTFHKLKKDKNNCLRGVGILIGPRIVLTVAHNICHIKGKEISYPKSIHFSLGINGDFYPFQKIKSYHYYVNKDYISSAKLERTPKLSDDWGLIFLDINLGEMLMKLFDVNQSEVDEIKVNGNFYNYFLNAYNINSRYNESDENKISIIGHTEYSNIIKTSEKFKSEFIPEEEKGENSQSNSSMLDPNQGKITTEFFQETIDLIKQNKLTLKNIDLSKPKAQNEFDDIDDPTESFVTNELLNYSGNGINYIILGNHKLNRNFDENDKNKLIISESIGEMSTPNSGDISYTITTYKGQSGSPVFYRTKDKDGKLKYNFIGLHSRRGPSKAEELIERSLSISSSTNNTSYLDIENIPQQERKSIISFLSMNNKRSEGVCDYNLAVGIYGAKKEKIRKIANEQLRKCANSLKETGIITKEPISTFVMVDMIIEDEIRLKGIFNYDNTLEIFFRLASKILSVPHDCIKIRIDEDDDYFINYDFDCNKPLKYLLGNSPLNSRSSLLSNQNADKEKKIKLSFEAMIMVPKFSKHISNKIVNKFKKEKGLSEEEIKNNFRVYTKEIFLKIFEHISFAEEKPFLYGNLFQKVRDSILENFGISDRGS